MGEGGGREGEVGIGGGSGQEFPTYGMLVIIRGPVGIVNRISSVVQRSWHHIVNRISSVVQC